MSVHLHVLGDRLVVAAGYEDGRVEVWSSARDSLQTDAGWDGRRDKAGVWTRLWEGKLHNEAGKLGNSVELTTVMAMAVDRAFTRAFTVSADHFLCRVDLSSVSSTASPLTLDPRWLRRRDRRFLLLHQADWEWLRGRVVRRQGCSRRWLGREVRLAICPD